MTNLRNALAALLVGASSLAIALPASAQDVGVDTDLSITGDADNGMVSSDTGADAGVSVDESGVTASISGDTEADVDTALGDIAANAEGTTDVEATVMAQIEGMSDEDMERMNDRCDDIVNADMENRNVLEVCDIILKHNNG